MSVLALDRLSIVHGTVPAVTDVSLSVGSGEVVALLGANGAGKSSLLRTVIGLQRAASGRIVLAGADVTSLSAQARARRGIGYVPEGRRVFPGMSVQENLDVAARASTAERARRRAAVYALFPVLAERATASAWQLSGGQQQMLAIGRALMTEPRLLLLDEPSLGLAPKLVVEMLARVRENASGGTAVLLAEQNVAQALAVSDRAYVLQLGRIVREGAAAELSASEEIRDAYLGALSR